MLAVCNPAAINSSSAIEANWPMGNLADASVGGNVGTSVRMIEKHYGKFLPSEKRTMLERGRIELEIPAANIVNLR
jgi:hypothetical protein